MMETAVVLGLAGILLLVCRIFYETHTFCVRHYEIHSPAFPKDMKEWTAVFLSDLHNEEYGENNERLIRVIRRQKPDLILVGGDMLIRRREAEIEPAVFFMKKMTEIAPVYCANGNHEQRMKEERECYGDTYVRYRKQLLDSGVRLLENETVVCRLGGMKAEIGGLEIPLRYYWKGLPFRKKRPFQERLEELIPGGFQEDSYKILLAHQPLYAGEYAKWGMDLVLCGHLHGGIIRVPFFGGIISPQLTLFPEYSGEHKKDGKTDIIVSKGLGMHSLKIRLFNRAEVVVIHGKS